MSTRRAMADEAGRRARAATTAAALRRSCCRTCSISFVQGRQRPSSAPGAGSASGLALVSSLVQAARRNGPRARARVAGTAATFTVTAAGRHPGRRAVSAAPAAPTLAPHSRGAARADRRRQRGRGRASLADALRSLGHEVAGGATTAARRSSRVRTFRARRRAARHRAAGDGRLRAGARRSARDFQLCPAFIAVTGYGQTSDIVRSAAEGFAGHLVKPVDAGQLQAYIAASAPIPRQAAAASG